MSRPLIANGEVVRRSQLRHLRNAGTPAKSGDPMLARKRPQKLSREAIARGNAFLAPRKPGDGG